MRRHRVAGVDVRIEAHAEPAGDDHPRDLPGRGAEILLRVLGVDAALDGRAARTMSSCVKGSGSPAATRICALIRSMPVTISVTGCSTWMRALTLDEVEVALAIDDELDGAGVGVAGRLAPAARPPRRSPSRVSGAKRGGGALLDQLLMAALHRAVALPQMDDVAVLVGQDLHFDVPRMLDVFLQVDRCRCRRPPRLRPGPAARPAFSARSFSGHAHAAAAAAGRRLDQHRKADLAAPASPPRPRRRSVPRCRARRARSASRASLRAAFLSPSSAIASCEGPMNSILQLRHTSAKWAFSDRKP